MSTISALGYQLGNLLQYPAVSRVLHQRTSIVRINCLSVSYVLQLQPMCTIEKDFTAQKLYHKVSFLTHFINSIYLVDAKVKSKKPCPRDIRRETVP